MQTDEGRKFVEYGVTLLAPSSSVIYAPDTPMTVSIPSIYEYRGAGDRLCSAATRSPRIREQQRYSVLTSVSTASVAELRQSGTIFPQWVRNNYLQLPPSVPQRVTRRSVEGRWRYREHVRGGV